MLRVNQLSGFGGQANSGITITTGAASNTNTPSFTVDLGPPGPKQVLCAFACHDTAGSVPWTWGTGSVGGEAFTYVKAGTQENAGNGGAFTGGATVRALTTSLGGTQTVSISMTWGGTMNATAMLAIVVRGVSPTALSYDGGNYQSGVGPGNDVTLNTAGARIVICAAAALASPPGSFQGPGVEVTAYTSGNISLGYDLGPAGGASDTYSFAGGKYVISGAAFG